MKSLCNYPLKEFVLKPFPGQEVLLLQFGNVEPVSIAFFSNDLGSGGQPISTRDYSYMMPSRGFPTLAYTEQNIFDC